MDDVLVVGGRCAGAATAMLLARTGLSVRLVERAPRLDDVVSGHLVKPSGVARLHRWGVLDALVAGGTPVVTQQVLWVGGERRVASAREAPIIAPRRYLLDGMLLDAARDAGVSVELGTRVSAVLRGRSGVVGVSSTRGERRARLTIGADGRHSRVATSVGAPYTVYTAPVSYAYYGYWRQADVSDVHAWLEPGLFVGMFPTNDDLTLGFYQAPAATFERARRDPVGAYRRALHAPEPLRNLLARATLVERLRGLRELPTFFRQSAGPGWALAGDAGHHKDPLIARGIADAFRDAEMLSARVAAGWDDDLDAALRGYASERDASATPLATASAALARLDATSSEMARAWEELARLDAATDPVGEVSGV